MNTELIYRFQELNGALGLCSEEAVLRLEILKMLQKRTHPLTDAAQTTRPKPQQETWSR